MVHIMLTHGQPIAAGAMTAALTSPQFVFPDSATQTFFADGRATCVEEGQPAVREWSAVGMAVSRHSGRRHIGAILVHRAERGARTTELICSHLEE